MFKLIDIIAFTLDRLRQHMVLVLWVLVGITVAVTLALSLPLYVDAVYSDILSSRLDDPPYAWLYRYLGAWEGNISLADVTSADAAINGQFADAIGLPVTQSMRYLSSGRYNASLTESRQAIGTFAVASLTGADSLMEITAGQWPPPEGGELVPLLLPENMLFTNGVQVGDELTILRSGGQAIEAYVAAMWRPINENDPTWLFPTRFFEQVLLVPDDVLPDLIAGVDNPVDEVAWYLIFDGVDLRTSEIDALLASSEATNLQLERTLPGITESESPEEGLRAFNAEADALTQQLFIIILPVGGLVLYFIAVVSGLLVTRQQAEDVTLRSRGMSRSGVLRIHIIMWAIIVGVSLFAALIFSPLLVQLIGRTQSFLDFTGQASVKDIQLSAEALLLAIGAGIVAASSGLLLAWRITIQNINSLKRVSRQPAKAWWQRTYLDVAAIALAGYTLYTLVQRQGIDASADSPFADPLTFIGPTLFALGLTLLFLRLLPLILGVLARILAVTSDMPLLMALREITRGMGRYRGTLLMTAFTLSLAGYTASMANTLDQSLLDVIRYRVGSELQITTITDTQTETSDEGDSEITGYNAPPVIDVLNLPEVAYLSRVGKYNGRLTVGGQRLEGTVIGVDREGLGGVTFMRDDYSDVPLGNLLNELALNRTGVILSKQVADQYHITVGDEVNYQITVLGEWQSEIRAVVVGLIDYFPTVDPSAQGFYLITSLQPLFEIAGTPLPFDVWINVAEGYTVDQAEQAITALNFPVLRYTDPGTQLALAQAEPGRRGVLGFLSVGFVAAIVLTLISAIIQSTASLQAQAAQLGSLRAMGMSSFSVRLYVLLLQSLIAFSGVGSGTLIGLGTTILFLPMFDFSGGLPPYQLRLAWDEILLVYGLFGAVLLIVALIMALVLTRQQLSRAVKLGSI
ncbi:MAG: hypothetical protein CL607_04985 [Anaerolineaceae bacterium]|nr:hypothetical protein [Anaerolineaceae bacterium]